MTRKFCVLLVLFTCLVVMHAGVRLQRANAQEQVTIFFSPANAVLPPDITLKLMLDAKSNKIGFARIDVEFDRTRINLSGEVVPTDRLSVFRITSQDVANTTGKIEIILLISPDKAASAPSGLIEFARIPFSVATSLSNQHTRVSVIDETVDIVAFPAKALDFTSEPANLTLNSVTLTAPVLLSPDNGLYTRDNTPDFVWQAVAKANAYQLQIDNDRSFRHPEHDRQIETTDDIANLLPDGTFYWRVRADYGGGTKGPWSTVRKLVIDTTKPAAPTITSPRDRVNTPDTTPRFTWRSVRDASRYHIQIASTPDFAHTRVDMSMLTRATHVLPDAEHLEFGHYYWRVRAYDLAGNEGEWSSVHSFNLTPHMSPKDGDFTSDQTPAFIWRRSVGDQYYQLQVSSNASFTTPIVNEATLTGDRFIANNVLPHGRYYWRMRVILAGGFTTNWSPAWTFTVTPGVPKSPSLQSPPNGWRGHEMPVPFEWHAVNGDDGYSYQIQASRNPSFQSPIIDGTDNLTWFGVSPFHDAGTYYWRVRAINEFGVAGQWSAVWRFTVLGPDRPTLMSPPNNSTASEPSPVLAWRSVQGGGEYTSYVVEIASDAAFRQVLQSGYVTDPNPPANSVNVQFNYETDVLEDGKYYWRVRAIGHYPWDIAGTWSSVWQLTIDSNGPDAPVLSLPRNGSGTGDSTPRLSWTASARAAEYRIQMDDDPAFGSSMIWSGVTGPSFTVPESYALPYGTYFWRVQARDVSGVWGAWSQPGTFDVTVHINPAHGSATTATRPVFRWAAVAGAQYYIQIDNNSDFSSLLVNEPRATNSYQPPAGLLSYGTFYWRVSLNDGASWMPTWAVTITPAPPGRAALSTPKTRTLTNDNTPILMWYAAPRGETYQAQIDDDPRFGSPTQDVTLSEGVLAYTAGPLPDGIHYWRVRALNAFDAPGPWSAVWRLDIDTHAPDAPSLVTPWYDARVTNRKLALQWSRVSDAIRYEVQLSPDPAFPLPPIDAGRRTTYRLPATLPQAIYYWRVRAIDKAGNVSTWSETRSFSLVAGLTALTAEPTPVPTVTEPVVVESVSLQVVEAEDPVIVLRAGEWTVHNTLDASGGAYVYSSGSPDDALSLRFSGTRLEVIYVKHPALGSFFIEVDGAPLQVVDTVAPDVEFAASAVVELDEGEHILRIYPQAGTIAIDAFAVSGMIVPEPTTETAAEILQPTPEPAVPPTVDAATPAVPVQPTATPIPTEPSTQTPMPTEQPTDMPLPTMTPTPTEAPIEMPMPETMPAPIIEPTVSVKPTEDFPEEVMPQDVAE